MGSVHVSRSTASTAKSFPDKEASGRDGHRWDKHLYSALIFAAKLIEIEDHQSGYIWMVVRDNKTTDAHSDDAVNFFYRQCCWCCKAISSRFFPILMSSQNVTAAGASLM